MNASPTPSQAVSAEVERRVEHELARASLDESRTMLLPMALIIVLLAAIWQHAGVGIAGLPFVVFGLGVIAWRTSMGRRFGSVQAPVGDGSRLPGEFRWHALFTGVTWSAALLPLFADVTAPIGYLTLVTTLCVLSISPFFFALVPGAVPRLVWPIVLTGAVALAVWPHATIALAPLCIVYGAVIQRTGRGHRRITALAIRRGFEAETSQRALIAARDAAEAAARAKSRFLANMSHEIRTPMNGIVGALELVGAGPLDAQQRRFVDVARVSGAALLDVINRVLDLSGIEGGTLLLRPQPTLLGDLARQVIDELAPEAQRRELELRFDLRGAEPEPLLVDATRLRQVLLNLVGNGIKFTDRGAVVLSLAARRAPDTGADSGAKPARWRCEFAIADTGIGIAAGRVDGLFAAFAQSDESDRRRHGGAGLGLTLARVLVEAMGGRISVVSAPGAGSTFAFALDLDAAPPAAPVDPAPPTAAERAPAVRRVLLVEDNEINRLVGRGMLDALGVVTIDAHDGRAALDRLADGGIDLVLMDCQMPVMDGFEATREWRRREAASGAARLPIVALTASALAADAQRCFDAGMDDHLAKPLTLDRLGLTLERWVGDRRPSA